MRTDRPGCAGNGEPAPPYRAPPPPRRPQPTPSTACRQVLHLWFTWKCWCQGEMSPAVWYWQAATYAAYALKISWKLRRKGTTLPFVGQPLVAALRLLGLGLGAQSVWLMVHRSMAAAAAAAAARPAGGAGGARDAVRLLAVLLFASSGVAMMMGLVTLRVAHLR